jgi:RNA polymerase sigma-70 factor (ECF subfamily)
MTGTVRREAVEQAYREHADDVYRVAYALLRDPDAAVDATHDAFARAYERWETYDARRPLRPWLMTIVANISRDALRRRRVRTLAIPALAAQAAAGAAGAGAGGAGADPAEIASRRALVETALDGLEPRARAALVLRHYHGYDYAEIATILGAAPGTVGSLLSRAHATLRARLEDASEASASGSRAGRAADREVLP